MDRKKNLGTGSWKAMNSIKIEFFNVPAILQEGWGQAQVQNGYIYKNKTNTNQVRKNLVIG